MIRYRLTRAAQADLEQIWDYTNANWGPEQAEGYLRELEMAVERIALNPLIGAACDEIRPGYRKLASGSHVVFYRVADVVNIVRVLHGRMDIDRNL